MEESQKRFIVKNYPVLLPLIVCSDSLFAHLQSGGVLSPSDVEDIVSKSKPMSMSKRLLEILMTRTNSFEKLVEALEQEKQSGAVNILKNLKITSEPTIDANAVFKQLPKQLKEIISRDSLTTNYVFILSHDINLSLKRIQDAYGENILHFKDNSSTNSISKDISQKINKLHLSGNCMFGAYKGCSIIICSVENENKIAQCELQHCEVFEDVIKWNDFTEKWQQKLLERKLIFLGNQLTLNEIFEMHTGLNSSESNLLTELDTSVLISLYHNNTPEIARANIPSVPKHYIRRRLLSRERISRNVLNVTRDSNCNDVFVFKGNELHLYDLDPLVKMYGNGQCDTSSSQIENLALSCHSILMDAPLDFDKICKLRHKTKAVQPNNFHLLECICNPENKGEIIALHWIRTVGSVSLLQTYVHYTQKIFFEDELHEITNGSSTSKPKSVCITGSPGMGKSCLLLHCAQQLKKRSTELNQFCVIHYVRMTDFAMQVKEEMPKNVHEIGLEDDKKYLFVYKALVKNCSSYFSSKVGRMLFESLFMASNKAKNVVSREIKFEIMFDGVEELSLEMLDIGLLAVHAFHRSEFPFQVRIWVTTRPRLSQKIEKELTVLGHTLQPFAETEQIYLLTNYWTSGTNIGTRKTETIAEQCLQKIKDKLSLFNDDKIDISSIPFFCFLIAQAFKKEYERICELGEITEFDERISNLTITDVFEEYILSCFTKNQDTSVCKKSVKKKLAPLFSSYMKNAAEIIFPGVDVSELITKGKNLSREELLLPGILESSNDNGPLKFFHSTFLDYFAAEAILCSFMHINTPSTNFEIPETPIISFVKLIKEAFSVEESSLVISNVMPYAIDAFIFRHTQLCFFINFSAPIKLDNYRVVETLIKQYNEEEQKLVSTVWEWLLAAIVSNHLRIAVPLINFLNILFKLPKHVIYYRKIFQFADLLFLAARFTGPKLMETVCTFAKQWRHIPIIGYERQYRANDDKSYGSNHAKTLTLLHVAFEAGRQYTAEYLLLKEGFLERILGNRFKNLLHSCLLKSLQDPLVVVNRKKKILNFIAHLSIARDFFIENTMNQHIILEQMHMELLLTYLKICSNLGQLKLVKNEYGQNFLHLIACFHYDEILSPASYNDIILKLHKIQFDLKKHLVDVDGSGWRAVDVALRMFDLHDGTLKLFSKMGIDFNYRDHGGNTPLFKAVIGQRQGRFLQKLISLGATCDSEKSCNTLLHVAAAWFNFSGVEFCVNVLKQDVNAKDEFGNTPLHQCFRFEDIAKSLESQTKKEELEFGDKVASQGPVSELFKIHCFGIDAGLSPTIYIDDGFKSCGNSKHTQIRLELSNQHQIISFLIEKGADISIPNKAGVTPMHLAIDIFLGGLSEEEKLSLKSANHELFQDPLYMMLALKGLLLNTNLGHRWHPSLINSFASQIMRRESSIHLKKIQDRSSLLHLASRAHSLYGVKYLIEVAKFSVNTKNSNNQTPLEYMNCTEDCKIYNHLAIKNYLQSQQDRETVPESATLPCVPQCETSAVLEGRSSIVLRTLVFFSIAVALVNIIAIVSNQLVPYHEALAVSFLMPYI